MTTRRFLFSISLMVKHVSVSRGVRTAMRMHLFNDSRRQLPAGYVPLSLVLPSQNIAHSIVTHALAIPRSYILFTLQCMACGWGKSSSSYRTGYVCSCVPGDHFPCQPGQSQSVRLSELTKINIQSSSQQPENIDMWMDGPGQSSVRVIFFFRCHFACLSIELINMQARCRKSEADRHFMGNVECGKRGWLIGLPTREIVNFVCS